VAKERAALLFEMKKARFMPEETKDDARQSTDGYGAGSFAMSHCPAEYQQRGHG
jgi:hypothetical protein